MACPTADELLAMFGPSIPPARFSQLELHIDACESCRMAVAALAAGSRASGTPAPFAGVDSQLTPGTVLDDRYEIREEVGRGGMGTVYLARDRKLDRDVALKLHRAGSGADRLEREAKAMAMLAHPNVAAVFEVEIVDDRLYVAMEYVRGQTLRGWLASPRPWRDIIAMLVASGRGLAAAHAAGLVHRDFKPENVLVGDDGRPRVADFGLARVDLAAIATDRALIATADTLTRGIVGTPAYMAPEQLAGQPADARCDQFAFCVVAWEALHGERPFRGATLAALGRAIEEHELVARHGRVPDRVRAVIERGLATDPVRRFADMPALLAALERSAAPRTMRRVLAGAAAVAVIVAGGAYAAKRLVEHRQVVACDDAADAMRARFGPPEHVRLSDAITRTGSPVAASLIEHTLGIFDRTTAALADRAGAVCRDDTLTEQARSARTACLAERGSELSSVIDQLGRATADRVLHAPESAWDMFDPKPCTDAPAGAAMSMAHAQRLGAVRAMRDAGSYQEARAAATALLAETRTTQDHAAEVETALLLGGIQDALDPQAATASYHEAAAAAEQQGRDLAAAAALGALANNSVMVRHDFAEAHRMLDLARAKLTRIGGNAALESKLAMLEARMLFEENRLGDADHAARSALALARKLYGPVHPLVGSAEGTLSTIVRGEGKPDEDLRFARAAVEHLRSAYGDQHPMVATALGNLGAALIDAGQPDAARAQLGAANALLLAIYGANHPERAATFGNLGSLERTAGHWEAARDAFVQARAILVALQGPGSPSVAGADRDLADALQMVGKVDEAIATDREAVAIYEHMGSDGEMWLGPALDDLCDQLLAGHQVAEALPLARRALAMIEKRPASDNPQDLADARFALGRVLWESADCGHARELVVGAGEASVVPERKQVIAAWLATHRLR